MFVQTISNAICTPWPSTQEQNKNGNMELNWHVPKIQMSKPLFNNSNYQFLLFLLQCISNQYRKLKQIEELCFNTEVSAKPELKQP